MLLEVHLVHTYNVCVCTRLSSITKEFEEQRLQVNHFLSALTSEQTGVEGEMLSLYSLRGSSFVKWAKGSASPKKQALTWYKVKTIPTPS